MFDEKLFGESVREHILSHPRLQPQDVVKFCYQAAFGAKHLLRDEDKAKEYFFREFIETAPKDIPLSESLGGEYARVNFAAWKHKGLDPEILFGAFLNSAESGGREKSEDPVSYLDIATKVIAGLQTDFSVSDWLAFLEEYYAGGIRPIRHSAQYRKYYCPSYRVVRYDLIRKLSADDMI